MDIRFLIPIALISANSVFAEPSIERGEYLVEGPAGCGNCHTPIGPEGPVMSMNLAARVVEETPAFKAIAPTLHQADAWPSGVMRSSSAQSAKVSHREVSGS
jgi:mono/diheme cytochrome c family protein